jgi:ATP-binding cassette, subfamily G (WHITE), member 2, PDR
VFPRFWIFMYRVSPFTYLIDGMLSTGVANTQGFCSDIEFRHFNPPSGMTCLDYLQPYISVFGGSVENPSATSDCSFCSLESTNTFLASVSSFYENRWRNFGLMWVYIFINAFGALFLYWAVRVPKGSKGRLV